MLLAILHWPDQADLALWSFAMEQAIYIWNNLPKKGTLLSPLELFTRTKTGKFSHLMGLGVWGCPVYVLYPQLQDGKKLPKWKPRSRQGMHLGTSEAHSNTVGQFLNMSTGYVSPQYHCVYDVTFSTVPTVSNGGLFDDLVPFPSERWNSLLLTGYERTYEPELDAHGRVIPDPVLQDKWLSEPERELRQRLRRVRSNRLRSQRDLSPSRDPPIQLSLPRPQHKNDPYSDNVERRENNENDDINTASVDKSILEMVRELEEEINRNIDELRQMDVPDEIILIEQERHPMTTTRSGREVFRPQRFLSASMDQRHPFREEDYGNGVGYDADSLGRQCVRNYTVNEQYFQTLNWLDPLSEGDGEQLRELPIRLDQEQHPYDDLFEECDPTILATIANAQDNLSWEEAMNGPDKKGYWETCNIRRYGAMECGIERKLDERHSIDLGV